MTQAEAYAVLDAIFADVFMRADIALSPTTTAKDVEGWDSIKQLEIIMSIEERFDFQFTTREIDSLSCAGDLAKIIVAKTN
jgi:acyl carrier protein